MDFPSLVYIEPKTSCASFYIFEGPYLDFNAALKWMLLKAESSGLLKVD